MPPGPVPTPIVTAQKVFIANGGMDATSAEAFQALQLSDTEPYDGLYAAMQSWGRYQLVSNPADADLVFEIRFSSAMPGWNLPLQPQSVITIYDAHSHFLLWTVTQPVERANLKRTWRKNIAASLSGLIAQIKALAPVGPANHP